MAFKRRVRDVWRRVPVVRLAQDAIIAAVTLQVITVIVLWVVATLLRRRKHEVSFPHLRQDEVQVGDNYLQLYAYGRDLYAAMLEAIDNAKESIYLETYIWKGDTVGQELKTHLVRKAEQGVDVYVIFDAFGNLVVPHSFKFFPPCVHTLEYQSIHRPWHMLDPRRYALDHRKILVVDGSIGFIGGYNLGSLYATDWRDTHLRIHGPVAADLAHAFASFWNRSRTEATAIARHYPRTFDPFITVRSNDALRLTFPIRDMYIEAIDRSEHTILLTNAYFVPDHFLLDSLKAAAARGVDVRVLIPWHSNHIVVDWLARGYITKCLKGGVRVIGYTYAMLHAKTCTVDGQWVTLGTANLDRLSSIGNFEINVEIYSDELARQMQKLFKSDTTGLFELTLEEWKKRPWYTKLSERILAPLRFLL
ncbi:MAG TPA: phosphatidylserine/phosphatidylglycerophosphate/cardiolipin synthase family protein [Ktedonobacteraceae bacterium]